MKTVIYYDENHTPDLEFAGKMQRLAKAFVKYDKEDEKVFDAIDKKGWDAVYDAGGFDRADKAKDILARRYNIAHGTSYDTQTFMETGEMLMRSLFTAQSHGLI